MEYGVLPHHIDDMTLREVEEYLTQLADLRKAQQEAARGSR